MTRIAYAALAAVALLSLAGAPARADDVETCNDPQGQPTIDACTRLIESGSLSVDHRSSVFNNRGHAYYTLDQYARAIQDWDETIRLEPDNPYVFIERGSAYYALGQYARAIQDFDEAIRLKPDLALAFSSRSNAERKMGNTAAADADSAKAEALDPEDW